jgi:hypothetical protein
MVSRRGEWFDRSHQVWSLCIVSGAGRFTSPNLPALEGFFASIYMGQIVGQVDLDQFVSRPLYIYISDKVERM